MSTLTIATEPLAALAPLHRRVLKHPRLMPYHRLIVGMLLGNLGILWHHVAQGSWRIEDGSALSALSSLTLLNLAVAVLIRQSKVLNGLFWLAGRGSTSWPLWLRWAVSKVTHVGGIHVGAALAGTGWFLAFAGAAATARGREPSSVSWATLALAGAIVLTLLIIVVGATPGVRRRAHDLFELTHRYGGWTAIGLFWALTVHLAVVGRDGGSPVEAVASSWQVWLLLALTASVAAPWLRLRRVPVEVLRPSAHAVILRLDYGVSPAVASAVAVSRTPLSSWHAFATVRTPGRPGYRLLISRAGDWTSEFVDDPPTHVWVRGAPTSAPLARVEVLYERVVYLVTGSGIGPCLGQVLAARVPARLIWSARSPRATYGDDLVDEVLTAQPDALVWDTARLGKPDLVELAHRASREFDAEAVFVVSNQATTRRVVHGLERRGVPAFGPIWDS